MSSNAGFEDICSCNNVALSDFFKSDLFLVTSTSPKKKNGEGYIIAARIYGMHMKWVTISSTFFLCPEVLITVHIVFTSSFKSCGTCKWFWCFLLHMFLAWGPCRHEESQPISNNADNFYQCRRLEDSQRKARYKENNILNVRQKVIYYSVLSI